MKEFSLSIISPEKLIYKGSVVSLVVPAALGYLGVLAEHAPLAANLTAGKIILKEASGMQKIFLSQEAGFIEVLNNEVSILLKNAALGGS